MPVASSSPWLAYRCRAVPAQNDVARAYRRANNASCAVYDYRIAGGSLLGLEYCTYTGLYPSKGGCGQEEYAAYDEGEFCCCLAAFSTFHDDFSYSSMRAFSASLGPKPRSLAMMLSSFSW